MKTSSLILFLIVINLYSCDSDSPSKPDIKYPVVLYFDRYVINDMHTYSTSNPFDNDNIDHEFFIEVWENYIETQKKK